MDQNFDTIINVYTVSLGCPKNRVDTERLLGALGSGVVPAESPSRADLVIINTCGFIQPAIEESLDTVFEAVQEVGESAGDHRPVLAVAGCLVSRFGDSLRDEIPEVDLWLTTDQIDQWPDMARKALSRDTDPSAPRALSTGPGHAYLKISEGCSHNCRFCTIPSIRGPHKSWTVDHLLDEAKQLLSTGVPELVVVGQDSTAYGSDLGEADAVKRLMSGLCSLSGLDWLRVMYLYPAGLTDDLLAFLRDLGRPFLPYFDIPLQHAHPDVLKSMGRPFARDPRRVIDRVRKYFPEAALRTTFIVGYPGETDESFQVLADFVREVRFHHLGVFPYWPEDGTPAAAMPNQVEDAVKQARRDEIMAIQTEISREIMASHVGRTMEVLVERESPEWPGLYIGRTWFQAPEVDGVTYVSAPPESPLTPGTIVSAEIEGSEIYDLSALVSE